MQIRAVFLLDGSYFNFEDINETIRTSFLFVCLNEETIPELK